MNRLEIISKETKEIHDKIYNASVDIKKEKYNYLIDEMQKEKKIVGLIEGIVILLLKNEKIITIN